MDCRKGNKNPNWKGGRKRNAQGYIFIYQPEHPHCHVDRYVLEHHLVMEAHLGRYLESYELVHHKNKVRDDNRIENLELMTKPIHMRKHSIRNHKMGRHSQDRPDVTVQKVKALMKQGHTQKEVAEIFHVSHGTISNRVRDGNLNRQR